MNESDLGKGDLLRMSVGKSVQRPPAPGKETLPTGAVLTVAVLAVGSAAILVRSAHAPILAIAFWRLALATFALLPLAVREGLLGRRMRHQDVLLLLASGAALAVHFVSWFAALERTSVLVATVLVSGYPVLLYVLERLAGEPGVGRGQLGPVLLALAGVATMSLGGGGRGTLLGAGLALLGALAMAVYLLLGRNLRRRHGVFTYVVPVYGSGALMLLAVALLTRTPLAGFPAATDVLLLALGLGPTLFGHTGFNYALRYRPATLVGLVQLAEPVVAGVLAFLLLGQRPGFGAILGSLLVLLGLVLFLRRSGRGSAPAA
jgi:drug/metabolite transporter (DMT)-like permease